MKLELGNIFIKNVEFGEKIEVKDGVLYISSEEIEKIVLEDERIVSVNVEFVRFGELIRIVLVKDVIEFRVKIGDESKIFFGIINKVKIVGSGRIYVFLGVCVVICGNIVGF